MDTAMLQALMAGLGQTDSALTSKLELFQRLMAQSQPPPRSDADQRRERVRRRIRHVFEQNAELTRRCDMLARALGACSCWGDEPGCSACNGRGRAGFYDIDAGLFDLFVSPALAQCAQEPPAAADSAPPANRTPPQQEKRE